MEDEIQVTNTVRARLLPHAVSVEISFYKLQVCAEILVTCPCSFVRGKDLFCARPEERPQKKLEERKKDVILKITSVIMHVFTLSPTHGTHRQ